LSRTGRHCHPERFGKKSIFLNSYDIFSMDKSQISCNLLKKAFTACQRTFPLSGIAFLCLSFPSFSPFLIFLPQLLTFLVFLLGFLPGHEFPRKHHRNGEFLPWSSRVVYGNFPPSFPLKLFMLGVRFRKPLFSLSATIQKGSGQRFSMRGFSLASADREPNTKTIRFLK